MDTLPILKRFAAPASHLCGMAWDGQYLWHSDGETNCIYQLDRDTGAVIHKINCPDVRTDLAFEGGLLWQVAGRPKEIRKIDPKTGVVVGTLKIDGDTENVCGLVIHNGLYYIGRKDIGMIEAYRVENRMLANSVLSLDTIDGLAIVGNAIWHTSYGETCLVKLDLTTGQELERYWLEGKPTGMCWDEQHFWYSDFENKRICAVRPPTMD